MLMPQSTAPAVLPLAERALSLGGAGSSHRCSAGTSGGSGPLLTAACLLAHPDSLHCSPGQQPQSTGQCGTCLAELWMPHFESKVNPLFLCGHVSFPGQL